MMNLLRQSVEFLIRPARRLGARLYEVVAVRDTILGVRTIDILAKTEEESRLTRVAAAMQLLDAKSAVWVRRMCRHLRAIVIDDTRTRYVFDLRTCMVSAAELDNLSPAEVALNLVHETTHAIIDACGYTYRPENRARIERACLRAELRLAKRIADPDLVRRVEKKFQLDWWEPDQVRAIREEEWRDMGLPEWLIRIRRLIRG